jgi:dTDP-4-dehydrorhamnose 3,5-epimerase
VKFIPTTIQGVWLVEPQRADDQRGFFARTWCQREFESRGLRSSFVQCSISFNIKMGTLRGMHYQIAPHSEAKLVRCTRGALYDVVLDLRTESPTFRQWIAAELTADNHRMMYVPEGCAHGFQTLTGRTEVFYQISEFYHPQCAAGVRWDDPAFMITWPFPPTVLSTKDREYPPFEGDKSQTEQCETSQT